MWICVPVFLISAAVLAYEYFVVGWHMEKLSRERFALIIAGGAVCTFLLFWSVSGMILRVVMSMKGVYFRSLNSFRSLSKLLHLFRTIKKHVCALQHQYMLLYSIRKEYFLTT